MQVKEKSIKALEIVRDHPGIRPGNFADLMWPDSDAHLAQHGCGRNGNGVQQGAGINKSAGGYLAKLCKHDYVKNTFNNPHGYEITKKGLNAIQQSFEMDKNDG